MGGKGWVGWAGGAGGSVRKGQAGWAAGLATELTGAVGCRSDGWRWYEMGHKETHTSLAWGQEPAAGQPGGPLWPGRRTVQYSKPDAATAAEVPVADTSAGFKHAPQMWTVLTE